MNRNVGPVAVIIAILVLAAVIFGVYRASDRYFRPASPGSEDIPPKQPGDDKPAPPPPGVQVPGMAPR